MPRDEPDLHFGPGSNSGFTPAGIAAFDDLRPAAVVRELIQNALDAARLAYVSPVVVRFRLSRHNRVTIPGMSSYMSAFLRAVESQRSMMDGELASQAKLVCKRISTALAKDHVDVLSIRDNGIGLDEQRMNALLSDGLSVKGNGAATGTYGNGHATAIPASDLRYVLYGGVTADGRRISAGHAVLASHYVEGEKYLRGGDGFYIRGFKPGASTLYRYASDDRVPGFINRELDQIEGTDGGHGTSVIIPAFNHFLERRQTLWDMVSHSASANFFVAIDEGELEVEVEDARPGNTMGQWSLDRSTLADVLEIHREKKRSASFVSGQKAFEAHRTFRQGKRQHFLTSEGAIQIRLADNQAGATRVDLCRNGMWITNRLPRFQGKFADRVPFHAVLSLKAGDGDRLHEFVRTAEGPLHDKIVAKRLEKQDRRDFHKALTEIVEWLRSHTDALGSDVFAVDDFLTLDLGLGNPGGVGSNKALQGAPIVTDRRPAQQLHAHQAEFALEGEGRRNGEHKRRNSSSVRGFKRRPQLPALFQAASLPVGERRRRIQIRFAKACTDAQLRLLVDEGLDATCDRHGLDKYAPAELNNVKVNGAPARRDKLEYWDGKAVGVKLGNVAEGSTVFVETDFSLAEDFASLPDPSLRIEVFKTPEAQPARRSKRSKERGQTKDV